MVKDLQRKRYEDADMISSLPESLKDSILMCMSTLDAVRTSVLSSKWRDRWLKLPHLIFDTCMFQQSIMTSQELIRAKFDRMVCHIVLEHPGPVTKIILHIPQLKSCSSIDSLIYYASRYGVEELSLNVSENACYKLPSSLFSSTTQLRILVLRNCFFNTLPSTFTGFNKLIKLQLDMHISYKVLGCLISLCPLLEILMLELRFVHCQGNLEINAPKLRFLVILGFFPNQGRSSNNNKLIDRLPTLEYLHMHYHSMKYFAVGGSPTKFPTSLLHLKDVKLESICLDEVDLFSYTLCLIRSSPNLKTLNISVRKPVVDDANSVVEYLKRQDYSDMTLNHLVKVNLQCINGTKSEMELIKILLEKSPTLKKMIIKRNTSATPDKGLNLELINFQFASPNAQVIIMD